ncbi:MAG: hypothetical protein JWQ32_3020 [Marmoricola sp.]|nr:hypothetical protein [Marmoricola sp.]
MAYDEDLADRIRELVQDEGAVTEKRMFGGLAFLIGGNMAVAASGQGGLLVRSDPDRADEVIDGKHVLPMEMRGREMTGWLRVDDEAVAADADLQRWVRHGVDYAHTLPPK